MELKVPNLTSIRNSQDKQLIKLVNEIKFALKKIEEYLQYLENNKEDK